MAEKEATGPEDPRVRFAAERTLLAWIRTGLTMMGFGFVVVRFGLLEEGATGLVRPGESDQVMSLIIGTVLVGLGVLANIMATAEHTRIVRRLNRGEPYRPLKIPLEAILSISLVIVGIVVIAFLLLD